MNGILKLVRRDIVEAFLDVFRGQKNAIFGHETFQMPHAGAAEWTCSIVNENGLRGQRGHLGVETRTGSLELGEAVDPILLPLAVLGDDFSGGILDKGLAGELAGDFFDFGFDFNDLAI